jgi:hypothetical protein
VSRAGRILISSAAFLVLCVRLGTAQTVGTTTGAIEGRVTDATGAVLPGVTIAVAGDALMGPRTTTSEPDGSYRFSGLPPGTYALSFALSGFATATRKDVRVSLGVTAAVDVLLEAAKIGEIVTVEGGAGVVDRRATMIATVFDTRELAQLPGARTIGAILSATPAVQFTRFDVGGSTAFAVGPFSVYGTSGFQRPTIEGMSVTQMNPLSFALDYGTFANVSVGTGAYGPEWPSPGLHLQFITKSGGNRYAGTLYAGYERASWQAHNIDERQIESGAPGAADVRASDANRLLNYRDLNGDAGGYLKKDRVWWYGSVRDHASSARQVIFPVAPLETRVTTLTGKVTWRATDAHQFVVFAQGGRNHQPIRLDGFLRPATTQNLSAESTSAQFAKGLVWKSEWSAVVGKTWFIEARAGQFVASRAERPNGLSPRTEDLQRPEVFGGNRDWQQGWRNDQVNAAASYFRDGPIGRHQMKVGLQIERWIAAEEWKRAYFGDVLHVTQSGIPREVYLFQTPSLSESGQWWYGAYAGDTWQVDDRLSLNLGFRFDRLRVFLPAQHHPVGRFNPTPQTFPAVDNLADWNVVAPRVSASYDLLGNGRTIVKGSYGFYWLPTGTDLGFNVNPNGRVWWERYKWADVDGDGRWQPGEEFDRQERRGGEVIEGIDPDLKLAYIREITGRLEREATRGLFIGTGVIWRGERQHGARQRGFWPIEAFSIPASLSDPGPDGASGTADDGPRTQLFELRPELLDESHVVVRNPPYAENDHLTWEIVGRRRFSRRWSVFASFAHTWNWDHAREYFGQQVRANEFPLTPNDFIHTDARGRHVCRDWSARVHGTWEGPWRIRVSPFLRHQAGQAFGRTLVARLNYGTIRVLAEPVGTRRQDHVTLLDLRVEKDVRITGANHLTPFVEVFNTLNANPEQNISWETGATFLRPLVIVPPRIVRVGFRLDW